MRNENVITARWIFMQLLVRPSVLRAMPVMPGEERARIKALCWNNNELWRGHSRMRFDYNCHSCANGTNSILSSVHRATHIFTICCFICLQKSKTRTVKTKCVLWSASKAGIRSRGAWECCDRCITWVWDIWRWRRHAIHHGRNVPIRIYRLIMVGLIILEK